MYLMVDINEKPIIQMHTQKRERNPNTTTKDSHQITREESKRRKGQKRTTKIN